jgi:hypothetical protein
MGNAAFRRSSNVPRRKRWCLPRARVIFSSTQTGKCRRSYAYARDFKRPTAPLISGGKGPLGSVIGATLLHHLGINYKKEIVNGSGRPVPLCYGQHLSEWS